MPKTNRHPIIPCEACKEPTRHKFSRVQEEKKQLPGAKLPVLMRYQMFACCTCGAERVYGCE